MASFYLYRKSSSEAIVLIMFGMNQTNGKSNMALLYFSLFSFQTLFRNITIKSFSRKRNRLLCKEGSPFNHLFMEEKDGCTHSVIRKIILGKTQGREHMLSPAHGRNHRFESGIRRY